MTDALSDPTDETPDTDESAQDVFAGDDPKAKFREAMARKAGKAAKNAGAETTDAKGGSEAHGPAKAQKMFRRKSGG
ncbi:MAG: DUF5302 domain-containing protein [Sporichthyaceae bacterium]